MSNEQSALVFLDTETTGLSLGDLIWEFAAIRREPDGQESRCHIFIKHGHGVRNARCDSLPEPFLSDHMRRYDQAAQEGRPYDEWAAASKIAGLFHDRPHVVGAVPNFDTERIALLLRQYGHEPGWHYHLIDVENLAVGYLAGVAARAVDEARMRGDAPPMLDLGRLAPPWDSDELSRACGVEPPGDGERHTAMGDAEWARRLYDAITGNSASSLAAADSPEHTP